MSPDEKALLEGIFYIMLILSAPFVFKMVYRFSYALYSLIVPVKSIHIKYVHNGKLIIKTIDAKDSAKIIETLAEADRLKESHVKSAST